MQKEDCIAIYLAPLLPVLLALPSLADTAHSLFLHIDNTGYEPSRGRAGETDGA